MQNQPRNQVGFNAAAPHVALRLPGAGFSVWTQSFATNGTGSAHLIGFAVPNQPLKELEALQTLVPRQAQGFAAARKTAKVNLPTSPVPQAEAPGLRLPGNAFTLWTRQQPLAHTVRLVSNSPACGGVIVTLPQALTAVPDAKPATPSAKVSQPEPPPAKIIVRRTLPFVGWAAAFLFLCALAAFLSSESGRQKMLGQNRDLQGKNEAITQEREKYHDNWLDEQKTNQGLTVEIAGLQSDLSGTRAKVTQLNAEKNGLSETIKDLRSSLAMAIQDHKNTEASLKKVIGGLEQKNSELTQALEGERGKLGELEARLAKVSEQLAAAQQGNQQLGAENTDLRNKVAELQTSLKQTIDDAQAKEIVMRKELDSLKVTNTELAQSLDSQKKELADVREQLKTSQEKLSEQSQSSQKAEEKIGQLSVELASVAQSRDALAAEKEALAANINELSGKLNALAEKGDGALKERIQSLEAADVETKNQVKAVEAAKEELLRRNGELQNVVDGLNKKLAELADQGQSKESALAKQVEDLSRTNDTLKESLEAQKEQLNALLKKAGTVDDASPQPVNQTSSEAERDRRNLAGELEEQTNQILDLNTRLAGAKEELANTQVALGGLDTLRQELVGLRSQGANLEAELTQRETRITALATDNSAWKAQAEHLRGLLESEQAAQKKLQGFLSELQTKMADATPAQARQ